MKVGFDISQMAHSGGVAVYTENLTRELSKIEELKMTYFYSSLRKPYKGKLKSVKTFKLPPTLFEVLFNRIRNVRIEKFIGPVDVFHSSDWVQPPSKAKKVTTYHDVIPLKFPKWSNPKIVDVHKRRLELVEREIDMVIAVSEATKRDLLELSKIPEEKIVVIYEAVDEIFKPQSREDVENFRKKYNLKEKFVLGMGGVGERKNLKRVRAACKKYPMVVTGEDLSVNKEEMPLLYSASEFLLYPSLYEGFGLPVLEAMACGIPVITSNVSSLPEVAGEAAILVDPESGEQIGEAVEKLWNDEALRKELVKKGFERAKSFSWKKAAEETFEVYKKIGQG